MRKNTEKVCKAFEKGVMAHPCDAVWTNGQEIYSYAVVIAKRDHNGTVLVAEKDGKTRWSPTTGNHASSVRRYFAMGRVETVPAGELQPV